MGPVEEVGWTACSVVTKRSPQSQKDEWEVVHPSPRARGTGPGHQAVFDGPMLPLDEAVALRVV